MNKIMVLLVSLFLLASITIAEQQGIHEPGTGIEDPDIKAASQGTGQGAQTNIETQQQNQSEDTQIQTQNRVKSGSYTNENGKQIQVQEQANNRIQLKSGDMSAQTSMQMTQEQTQAGTKLQVKLSNGKDAEVKVMPDTASEKALESLKLNVCSEENECQIELKEVGQGEQVRAAYEIQVQKQAKILGLFRTKMQVQAQVDAENGEVIQSNKPWWAFLASESEE